VSPWTPSEQLDPRRPVQEGVPGSLLRDVHRRAAAGAAVAPGARYVPSFRPSRLFLAGLRFIRMAAISRATSGWSVPAGSEIGATGLPDALETGVVGAVRIDGPLPSDAVSTSSCGQMADRTGSSTPDHPQRLSVIYDNARPSRSAAKVLRRSDEDKARWSRRVTLHSPGRRPAGAEVSTSGDRLLLGQADRRRRAGEAAETAVGPVVSRTTT